ncbi:hypothetical protein [Algibacillus agarilyticus]|uniref:hypothetical protein n=1 Tax=Algibacillus agarilyticus TaxID=2234133 RepID=UPI000DD0AEC6|nr:hypothetical protein [Algibacillus agarilyticus]
MKHDLYTVKVLIFLISISSFIFSCSTTDNLNTTYRVYPNNTPLTGNSLSWSEFIILAEKGKLSGKYLLTKGNYTVDKPINIRGKTKVEINGEDGLILTGSFDFSKPNKVLKTFVLHRGNIKLQNLNFSNVGSCISVAKNSNVNHVIIYNLKAQNVHSCIVVDRNLNSFAYDWDIRKVKVVGYYRVAIRISGKNTHNFMLSDLHINGDHDFANNHCFKGGIQIYNSAYNIKVSHAHIENNIGNCEKSYQQGDGIEADNKGGTPKNLTFENVTVQNSRDGNFDLKAEHVILKNIVSIGGEATRYAFKLWTYNDYSCFNCELVGRFDYYVTLVSAGFQVQKLKIEKSQFQSSFIKCQTTLDREPPKLDLVDNPLSKLITGKDKCINEIL